MIAQCEQRRIAGTHFLIAILAVLLTTLQTIHVSADEIENIERETHHILNQYVAALKSRKLAEIEQLLAEDFVSPDRWGDCDDVNTPNCRMVFWAWAQGPSIVELNVTEVQIERDIARANISLVCKSEICGAPKVLLTEELWIIDGSIRSAVLTLRTEDAGTERFADRIGWSLPN